MPKVTAVQTNFTAGELSPKMWGRVDVARYANGAEIIENGWPLIHGGVEKRWGTLLHSAARYADKAARLIPFVHSRTQAYILEFGDLYMRVHTDAGLVMASPGVPYQIATPYDDEMIQSMDYCQGADTMLLWHAEVYPRRLRRFADAKWVLDATPFEPLPLDETGEAPHPVTLSNKTVGTGRTAVPVLPYWKASDVGREIWYGSGVARITAVTTDELAVVDVIAEFDSTSLPAPKLAFSPQTGCTPSATGPIGASITLTLDAEGWRVADAGKWVKINGGWVKLTGFPSYTVANGIVKSELTTTVKAESSSWSINGPVWNADDGYPSTGTFHSQRLIAAGSPGYPQTVWGSVIGEYFNMQPGDLDTDAFAFQLVSDDLSPIAYLSSMQALLTLSYGGESTLDGGVEKPITPTNVRAKPHSNHGCAQVRPVRVGDEEVFVQRTGRRIRAASYNESTGSWSAPDLSVLSDHLVQAGVVSLTWHKEPGTLLMAARTDGVIASCTFDREQDVAGWARQITDGVVESVATIPNGDGDRTFLLVRRVIDGATVRYIEKFEPGIYSDCTIRGTSETPTASWTGFDALEGCEVVIKADGVPQERQTVTGGAITLSRTASAVEVGLPYKLRVKLLPPEVTGGSGAAKGSAQRCNELMVQVLETVGMTINGETVAFRSFGEDVLDVPGTPFTGIKSVPMLGWDKGLNDVVIEHDDPLPCHILCVIRKFTFNEG